MLQPGTSSSCPEADFYTFPETAHFLMMEKPIEFNRMLLKFVEKFR